MDNKEAIKNAYRRAMLHCHPDKRHKDSVIPTTYYNLVKEAFEWLERGDSTVQFKGYPVVFDPQTSIGQPTVFKIPTSSYFTVCECGEILLEPSTGCNAPSCEQILQDFKVCNACKTAIPIHGYDLHISQHELCDICGLVADKDHNQVSHPETICPICEAVNLRGHLKSHTIDGCSTCRNKLIEGDLLLATHIINDHHNCPLCEQKCGDNFNDHLFIDHHFKWDGSCDGCYYTDTKHFRSHQWVQCPYSKCQLDIAQGQLWKHARDQHDFRRCPACPKTEDGFAKDIVHAQAHEIVECSECPNQYQSYDLPDHQVDKHGWLLCTYCSRAEDSEEMLLHIREDHRLASCSICQIQCLEEEINKHLSEIHNWLKCSWCNEAFTEKEIRTHISVSHPPQELCACGYKSTNTGLKFHRIHTHKWQQCAYCEHVKPIDQFEQHVNEHQLTVCQECNIKVLPEKRKLHLQETHQYVQCPFCEYLDSRDNMLEHIQSHLDQSQLLSPVPTSGLPILSEERQDITGQSQECHPIIGDQVGKRKGKNLLPKCDYCRERKIKVKAKGPEYL
jgi:hypothetical protein